MLDFGLAKAAREGEFDSGLTHEGQMLGTPDYIAPEQIVDAQKADIRADIYSLGCTLYYLLSGGPPFRGVSLYDLFQAHHSTDAKPLNFARPEVPTELAALVAKMMAKEPERRFKTPAEVSEALAPGFTKKTVVDKNPSAELSVFGRMDSALDNRRRFAANQCCGTGRSIERGRGADSLSGYTGESVRRARDWGSERGTDHQDVAGAPLGLADNGLRGATARDLGRMDFDRRRQDFARDDRALRLALLERSTEYHFIPT